MARGQDGFASPFLYDSFIHYFTPVYPDAIQAKAPAPPLQAIHFERGMASGLL